VRYKIFIPANLVKALEYYKVCETRMTRDSPRGPDKNSYLGTAKMSALESRIKELTYNKVSFYAGR
jgi:hypothetical protein